MSASLPWPIRPERASKKALAACKYLVSRSPRLGAMDWCSLHPSHRPAIPNPAIAQILKTVVATERGPLSAYGDHGPFGPSPAAERGTRRRRKAVVLSCCPGIRCKTGQSNAKRRNQRGAFGNLKLSRLITRSSPTNLNERLNFAAAVGNSRRS
jgi:hypothetical protein